MLTAAPALGGGNLTVVGTCPAGADVEFYVAAVDPLGYGEGQSWIATLTEGSGSDSDPAAGVFDFSFAAPGVTTADTLTALARLEPDPGTYPGEFNTSEFGPTAAITAATIDLSLTKSLDDATPTVGTDVVFTLIVANAGPGDATGVQVTDLLPAGFTYSSDDGGGSYDSGTGVWTVGSVSAGAADTLAIGATVHATGPWVNTAEITAADQTDADSTPGNGDPAEDDQASAAATPHQLVIHKRAFLEDGTPIASGVTAPKGARVKFLLYLNNPGGLVADVSLRDVIDPGFAYIPGTIRFDNSIGDCAADTCDAAEEATIYAAVNSGTVATDGTGDDVASFTAGALDLGDENAANARLDVGGASVWATIFTVKVD